VQAKANQTSTGNTDMEKNQNCSQTDKVKPREELGKVRDFSRAYSCTKSRQKIFKKGNKIYMANSFSDTSPRKKKTKHQ